MATLFPADPLPLAVPVSATAVAIATPVFVERRPGYLEREGPLSAVDMGQSGSPDERGCWLVAPEWRLPKFRRDDAGRETLEIRHGPHFYALISKADGTLVKFAGGR